MAIIDWYSRYVLSWRLSNSLESDFCVEALNEALVKYGDSAIFNSEREPVYEPGFYTKAVG